MPILPALNVEVLDDGSTVIRARALDFVGSGVAVTGTGSTATVTIAGGGGGGTDPPEGSYAPGSYTIATGKFRIAVKRQQFTGTQRLTVQGTGRLRIG